jgi:hypothetical protein
MVQYTFNFQQKKETKIYLFTFHFWKIQNPFLLIVQNVILHHFSKFFSAFTLFIFLFHHNYNFKKILIIIFWGTRIMYLLQIVKMGTSTFHNHNFQLHLWNTFIFSFVFSSNSLMWIYKFSYVNTTCAKKWSVRCVFDNVYNP